MSGQTPSSCSYLLPAVFCTVLWTLTCHTYLHFEHKWWKAPCNRLVQCLWTSATDLDTEIFGALLLVTSTPFSLRTSVWHTKFLSQTSKVLHEGRCQISPRKSFVSRKGDLLSPFFHFFRSKDFMPDVLQFNAPDSTGCVTENDPRPPHRLFPDRSVWEDGSPPPGSLCSEAHASSPSCTGFCSSLLYTLLLCDISSPSGFIFYPCQ